MFVQDVLVSFFHMLEATEKGMKNIQPLSANEKKAVVGGTWLIGSQEGVFLTLIAAFSGRVFVAQVELHLLLSGTPFLQVLIHHVVKGDGSLWRGENIRHNTFQNNKPCTLILERSLKSFVPQGGKSWLKDERIVFSHESRSETLMLRRVLFQCYTLKATPESGTDKQT